MIRSPLMYAPAALAIALGLAHLPLAAEESTVSTNIAGALNTATGAVGAYGSSAAQMQMLVNQFAMMQQLQGQMSPQLQALNQVKMNLANAMAEAQMCVQNAKKDTSKYKKATLSGPSLDAAVPSCATYGNMIDSIKKNSDELNEANTRIGCIRNFQNKINQIAEASKAPFNQLTQAATKVWNTRDQIIKIHENISQQLDQELNAKGGLKEQLRNLETVATQLNNSINGSAGGDGKGLGAGLAQKIDNLKRRRVEAANSWYYSIMRSTQSCFRGQGDLECFGGTPAAPLECVARYLQSKQRNSPGGRARAAYNVDSLKNAIMLNDGKIRRIDQFGNIDIKKPEEFASFTRKRFEQMVSETVAGYANQPMVGNVDRNELASFVRGKYRECFERAMEGFNAGMSAEGTGFKEALNQVTDAERQIANEAKIAIENVERMMTDFRTSFSKTYNRELSMFTAGCTASEDAYESVNCLRKVQGLLNAGIKGHPQTVKLEDGSTITVDAGMSQMSIPNLTLDANGQPSPSQTAVSCVGFKECLNSMDKAKASHDEAFKKQMSEQQKFVEKHNEDVNTLMGGVAESFKTMSEMIVAAVNGLNGDLKKAGVTGEIEIEQVKGEPLEKDDKTGLVKTPTSMKAAFAGLTAYSEMGKVSEGMLDSRRELLLTKMQEALKMKVACNVTKADYDAIFRRLDCSEDKVCDDNNLATMLSPLESTFKKSQLNGADRNERGEVAREYNRCVERADDRLDRAKDRLSEAEEELEEESDTTDALAKESAAAAAIKKRDKKTAKTKLSRAKSDLSSAKRASGKCLSSAVTSLDGLAQNSRGSLKDNNTELLTALRKLGNACSRTGPRTDHVGKGLSEMEGTGLAQSADDDLALDDAVAACKKAQSLAKNPKFNDEGETQLNATGTSDKHESVIKGAQ